MRKYLASAFVALVAAAAVSSANASTLTLTDLGTVNPAANNPLLTSNVTITSVNNAPVVLGTTIQYAGIPNSGSVTYTDGSVGWNPFGSGDSTNQWISIGGAGGNTLINGAWSSATFTLAAPETAFTFVWGSPSSTNTVSLYSGANGTGTLIGSATVNDLDNLGFSNTGNTTDPGAIIEVTSSQAFQSAVLSTAPGNGGFEVGGVSAVPLPGTLSMFAGALAGLGFLARRRKAKAAV